MPGFGAEIEMARSMDHLYPQRELEFLSQNAAQDPLLFKVSELVYRQCQKQKEREKQKKTAKMFTVIVCCLLFSLTIALLIGQYFDDKALIKRADTIMNMTYYESLKNESGIPILGSTGGGGFSSFFANVISGYIKNTNSTT